DKFISIIKKDRRNKKDEERVLENKISEHSQLYFPHAYSILDIKEEDGVKMVKLRNPWGKAKGKFRGKEAPKFGIVETKDGVDGTFWITFDDFLVYFSDIVFGS
ncbi:MAG: C2 family cysteine protease, partial [Spirochaetia bacterium]